MLLVGLIVSAHRLQPTIPWIGVSMERPMKGLLMTADSTNTANTALVAIDFHGDQIVTFQKDGEPHVAMRRVVENIGLAWQSQLVKLRDQANRFGCHDIVTTGADGKTYAMLAMPVAKLPLWLATINPNKITDADKRQKVEWYQAESAIVLHDYWTKGVAVRGDMDGMVTNLDPSVMRALGGMMKGIVQKQISEMLPALVNERIMSGRLTVVEGVCAVEVVEMAGYKTGMRPRGVSQFVTRRLARFHEDRGVPIRRDRRGIIKARLFDEVTARQWLAAGGKVEVDHYIAGRKGQGALKLVV